MDKTLRRSGQKKHRLTADDKLNNLQYDVNMISQSLSQIIYDLDRVKNMLRW